MKEKLFDYIDLFAGIGGFHIAMDRIGGNCVLASEKDKFARKTYAANFPGVPINEDATNLKGDIPHFDVLCAGFPCQPFSNAGKKLGFADTKGTLFFEIERIVKSKIKSGNAPKIIFMENVKHFKYHDRGRTFATVRQSIIDLGYKFEYKLLNSKDFGLPQNRERVFMVAWRPELSDSFEFPKPPTTQTKVGNILIDKVDEKYTISDKLWAGHKRRREAHRKKGNGFGYCLFTHESEYTSTMSARYYKDGSEILIEQKDKNPRKITPEEALRLQGFPDNYTIPVSDTQAYKQFGNTVSVPVVTAIAKEIERQLIKQNKEVVLVDL